MSNYINGQSYVFYSCSYKSEATGRVEKISVPLSGRFSLIDVSIVELMCVSSYADPKLNDGEPIYLFKDLSDNEYSSFHPTEKYQSEDHVVYSLADDPIDYTLASKFLSDYEKSRARIPENTLSGNIFEIKNKIMAFLHAQGYIAMATAASKTNSKLTKVIIKESENRAFVNFIRSLGFTYKTDNSPLDNKPFEYSAYFQTYSLKNIALLRDELHLDDNEKEQINITLEINAYGSQVLYYAESATYPLQSEIAMPMRKENIEHTQQVLSMFGIELPEHLVQLATTPVICYDSMCEAWVWSDSEDDFDSEFSVPMTPEGSEFERNRTFASEEEFWNYYKD